MNHRAAYERLPDLLVDRDDPELVAHLARCHDCQQQLFRLTQVDRMLRGVGARRRRLRGRAVGAATAAAALAMTTPGDSLTTTAREMRQLSDKNTGSISR